MVALLVTGAVFALLLLRVPVAFAFLTPSLAYLILTPGLDVTTAPQRVIAGVDSFILVAVPLFILVGNLMNAAGITDRIFGFVQSLVGHVKGSLAYVNIGASIIFAGMSGSAVADAAGLGQVEIAAMRKAGYGQRFTVGLTAASSVIGPIVPPSIIAVVYGATAGVSIGGLFLAGIGPGLVIALMLAVMVFLHSRRWQLPRADRSSWRHIGRATVMAFPALMTPVVLLGGIISGLFTPTEAAGVAVLYAAAVGGLIHRTLSFRAIYRGLVATAHTSGTVLLIVGAASLYGWILTREGAPQKLYGLLVEMTDSTVVFLLLMNVLLLGIGMIMEPIPSILILVPIVVPVAEALGISPMHFGIMVIVNLTIGMVTPPVGNVLYALNSVTDMSFGEIVQGVRPFFVPLLAGLLITTYVPWVSLALPTALGFR